MTVIKCLSLNASTKEKPDDSKPKSMEGFVHVDNTRNFDEDHFADGKDQLMNRLQKYTKRNKEISIFNHLQAKTPFMGSCSMCEIILKGTSLSFRQLVDHFIHICTK